MLSRRTVFVVGAGASAELDLPIGEGLKSWIADALALDPNSRDGIFKDKHVETAVRSYVMEEEPSQRERTYKAFEEAATVITKALPFALSIDQYLDSQRANPTIVRLGKIGIASSILKAEGNSSIGKVQSRTGRLQDLGKRFPQQAGKTWHLKLVQLLTAGRAKEDLHHVFDSVAFIVFNYDRCLEHYLTLALSRYYGEDTGSIRQALASLKIVHPYGQVGGLTWQGGVTVPFGGEAEGHLRSVADDILTFTESANSGVTSEVKGLIEGAETLVFMGFGYLPQNVELLTGRQRSNAKRVFYTTKGVSKNDSDFVDDDLERILRKEAQTGMMRPTGLGFEDVDDEDAFEKFEEPGTCNDLMNNNWMRLTR